ncbi:MAG: hypothetical protein RL653_1640 [Pseudomonadota bacterium]
MAIAFFDLDRTLLAVNSASLWVRREFAEGNITKWQALQAASWLLRYKLGFGRLEDVLEGAVGKLAGVSDDELRAKSTRFYQEQLRTQFRPRAREVLEQHRSAGDRLVMLTSSWGHLADLIAGELGMHAVLCNRFALDARGILLGQLHGDICYGEGKVVHARRYAAQVGGTLEDAVFYTDSYSDLPVLHVVGRPVVVNPDGRLRREAVRRGWALEDWGQPGPGLVPVPAT